MEIKVWGEFSEELLASFRQQIGAFSGSLEININSRGGYGKVMAAMCKLVESYPGPTTGKVVGEAHSAAFELLQSCQRRVAVPSATFMFHCPRIDTVEVGFFSPEPYVLDQDDSGYLAFLERLSKRSGRSRDELEGWGYEERIFSTSEALELGLIDAVESSEAAL